MECVARVREVALKSAISIRPTSYVELDGEIAPGMSGGPCFDREWNIVGMCSKGLEELSQVLPPLSIMALLWPAMGLNVDLFKTGQFPVWNLFKEGPTKALGSQRVHVSSTGKVQFALVDPSSLVELPRKDDEEILQGSIRFTAENARRALVDLRSSIADYSKDKAWSAGAHRSLRHFFWELESATHLAMRLAALNVGFALNGSMSWDDLVAQWNTCQPTPAVMDSLASLGFSWNGPALFEVRTYADQARRSVLRITCVQRDDEQGNEELLAIRLGKCRVGGPEIDLPDGLERHFSATRHFVQSLLRLSREHRSAAVEPSSKK
jgi:hypothetical protein